VNGYRIELAEVEIALGSHPHVEQAVVIVRNGQLVGYVKGRAGVVMDAGALSDVREQAARSLTAYMMPR